MRTYDPADGIRYVHLAQEPAAPAIRRDPDCACHRLPGGYANGSVRTRLGGLAPAGPAAGGSDDVSARPTLVVLTGGAAEVGDPSSPAPALRLA